MHRFVFAFTIAATVSACARSPQQTPDTPAPTTPPEQAGGPMATPPAQPVQAPPQGGAQGAQGAQQPQQAPQQPASPRDSVRTSIGAATVSVNYGRPYMRGRTIFGGLVPHDRVWRTGANEATAFVTTHDLMVGNAHVPAGSYTLYTLPTATGMHLIINRQTGQWGTTYDEARDLARVPMRVSRTPQPVEQFTIGIRSTGANAGTLHMEWENTRAEVSLMQH